MKIKNLLEAPYKTDHIKTNAKIHPNRGYIDGDDVLGKGRTAVVTKDTDPHMVNRKSKLVSYGKADGEYDLFAQWVLGNEEVRSNPHFPRIYEVNSTEHTEDMTKKVVVDYKIEKLHPVDSLSKEEIRAIMDTHFEVADGWKDEYEFYEFAPQDIMFFVYSSIHSAEDSEKIQPTGEFEKACVLLEDFMYGQNEGITFDLHYENIMVRRGRSGLQLVFTDPIAYL